MENLEKLVNGKTNNEYTSNKEWNMDFLDSLKDISNKNGYFLQSSNSDNPEVILIGDYHPYNLMWFSNNIESILSSLINEGDKILMEGTEGEVIYNLFNLPESPIYNICRELKSKKIKSYFNDSLELRDKQSIAREILQKTYDEKNIEGNKEAMQRNQELMNLRNNYFVEGPFGIDILEGRKYQVVGMSHIEGITKILDKKEISYAIITPLKIPSDEEIQNYIQYLNKFENGNMSDKIGAIKELEKVPIRKTFNILHQAVSDKSGNLRKHAGQSLGRLQNLDSIDILISQLNNRSDEVAQWSVARALSHFNDSKIEDKINEYLSSNKGDKWILAALLMYDNQYNSSIEKLYEGTNMENPFIRSLSINLLSKYENLDLEPLIRLLNDDDAAVREETVHLFKKFNLEILKNYDFSAETDEHILSYLTEILNSQTKNSNNGILDIDKAVGSIYGALIGDALGAPIECMGIDKIKENFGILDSYTVQKRREATRPAGSITDDGELTLKILESLTEKGRLDPRDISLKFGEIGKEIDENFNRNIGYGSSAVMAFRKLYVGVNWRFTGNDSEGCGAAMRVAPLSIFSNPYKLKADIYSQSLITHDNNHAIAGALAIGYSIQRAATLEKNFDKKLFLNEILDYIGDISKDLSNELSYLKYQLDETNPNQIMEEFPFTKPNLKKGVGVLGTVPSAIYSFLVNPDNFKDTIITSINHSGDSDSIGAMAGAISGAYNGVNNIPFEYITGLYNYNEISKSVNKFIK
ncbi:hypothetical protein C0585_03100 [Candidatus Woesearchaeota archaeon]|nr:MAG: hypothetical protein C0585_03100 [Candidatus Woesearchaeota archaeon]